MRFLSSAALAGPVLLGLLAGCQSNSTTTETTTATTETAAATDTAFVSPPDGIKAADIGAHIKVLASDEFQGRKPFTVGEEKATAYLADEFKKLGLKPGPSGSYFQDVPLVEITGTPSNTMQVTGKAQNLTFNYKTDFMAFTEREVPSVALKNSELVFAGYGVVAPEYGWNDYAGLDVKGKTVVVLVNDPGNAGNDTTMFQGKAMTYYGRWMYKYEEAARQGAAGLLIVHDTKPAAYPWSVVQSSYSGAKLRPQTTDKGASKCAIEGWITLDATKKLFQAAGLNYDQLYAAANKKGFKAQPMGLNLSVSVQNKLSRRNSKNVVAVLPGASRPNEYILYSAHWDHLGIGPAINGDSIYNGAVDNASGCAALLSIAKAFKQLPQPPARSIVFLAVTGEEQGLLGSGYYAAHPLFPLNKTVADINMDALSSFGPMRDLTVVGLGQSDLDDYAREAAKEQDRYIQPDPQSEKGYYYRSDHFNFAKVGVPSLYASGSADSRAKGKDYITQQHKEFEEKQYHQPSDEYHADWDLRGMEQDARLLFRVGQRLSNETTFPGWKSSSEFRAIREKSLGQKPQA
ncbi:Zn-dependent amino- or carboxypeptidase, M28 family [Hymenobacter gelipurpurascens]|uniref:Zn-dependent amino- or carboxypeptidase, M28 family n=1 Tax=Hymenobacter gelipurpurascens TaxID=89968 RepID=A0A212UFP0_9BACT|nr:M28 family metallopeptidase [Hymenobacter gelipurpurascens]SNC76941.1 Zn-dependent amino- or carboxypeptidase, M28 family [Hymenobacter gelipurpurascens]